MRIQSIRFKNLNSLRGEWKIDLTDAAFVAEGIFAITGPTGSGKSTILDAICLALYGRTPRLSRVNKSTNEVMSRQTGECFAEVCFETQSGHQTKRYVCHWSQHRARKKAQGELQSPRHEISCADSGEVLEHQLSAVARRIIRISGMDFERFTRSMLLAQGGFAAFLQADADERAPILEQITGTGIYSQISMKVHEYRASEHKILDNLQAEISGMEVLSTEEEGLLTTALSEKNSAAEQQAKEHKEKNRFIQWRQLIAACEQQQLLLEQQQQASQQRLLDFQLQQLQLDQARKALELSADSATLNSLRKEQKNSTKQWQELKKLLPQHEEQLQKTQHLLTLDSAALEQNKIQHKVQMEVIRQVRALDLKINEKEIPIKAAQEKLAETEVAIQLSQKKIQQNTTDFEQNNIQWQEVNTIIVKNQSDEPLVAQLTGINTQLNRLRELDLPIINKQQELDENTQQNIKYQKSFAQQALVLASEKKSVAELQKNYAESQQRLKLLLNNKEISVWRNELSQYKDRQRMLKDISSHSEQLQLMQHEQQAADEQLIHLSHAAQKSAVALETLVAAIKIIEREIVLLEDNLSLQNKIQAWDEERKKLRDNENCPLCGAIDHPYARGNIPDVNKTRMELDEAKESLSKDQKNLSEQRIKQIGNNKEAEQIEQQKIRLLQKIHDLSGQIKTQMKELDEDNDIRLQQKQQENNELIMRCSASLDTIEDLQQNMLNYREKLDQSKEALQVLELDNKNSEHLYLSSEKTIERLSLELNKQREVLSETLNDIQDVVIQFNIEHISLDLLDETQALLTQRRDQWLDNNAQKNYLEQKINQLKLEQKHHHENSQKLEKDLHEQQLLINDLSQIWDELQLQRGALFAHKNPDEEAEKLSSAVEKSEQSVQKSRQAVEKDRQNLLQLKTGFTALDKEILTRDIKLKQQDESFKIRLKQLDFTNEEAFKQAYLSEEQRNKLTEQEKLLSKEQTELAVKIRDNNKKLAHERQKNLTEQELELLQLDFAELENQLRESQGELGAIQQKLTDNAALREVQKSRLLLIDKQKQECHHWDVLHNLIGSADGKKYRNFAQGLTFEMMVGHANQQLQKMTQRYLLVRDEQQPLELNVVDNFQAGEVRSTKNLSGGESFIVSLSLALGLSQMASKNVRVDSLFLDEGFGTLDEEALDTALETLSGLQQEGKLIGVISHVQALKDRISTQISVIPLNGGRSEIIGRGCSSISHESAAVAEN